MISGVAGFICSNDVIRVFSSHVWFTPLSIGVVFIWLLLFGWQRRLQGHCLAILSVLVERQWLFPNPPWECPQCQSLGSVWGTHRYLTSTDSPWGRISSVPVSDAPSPWGLGSASRFSTGRCDRSSAGQTVQQAECRNSFLSPFPFITWWLLDSRETTQTICASPLIHEQD